MLFTTRTDDFESEKERNVYYKYFAGYFFNELVPDVDSRVKAFCSLLSNCTRGGKQALAVPIELTPAGVHVSFDNYEYQFSDVEADRGEFADIFIHDRSTRVLVLIEAKVHTDWKYDKDIDSNEERIGHIEEEMAGTQFVPCLLVTRKKWEACKRHDSPEHSNYLRMIDADYCRTRVILWEELLAITNNARVEAYLEYQLARPRGGFRYSFEDDWFVRQ